METTWRFIGTGMPIALPFQTPLLNPDSCCEEISGTSCTVARHNVLQNDLEERIEIQLVEPNHPILLAMFCEVTRRYSHLFQLFLSDFADVSMFPLHLIPLSEHSFAFTMCNPPFYASEAEIEENASNKAREPTSVCTGAVHEMVTEGGEERFVLRMLEESAKEGLRERCWWYTSMVGKLSTLGVLVDQIRALGIDNYVLTELVQGQTRRWIVAWSFRDVRLPDVSIFILTASASQLTDNVLHRILHEISHPYIARSSHNQTNSVTPSA